MWARDASAEHLPARPPGWVEDELIGLDRDDPEVQEFADHLDRMHRERPTFTIEGYLAGMRDFAESANRAAGGRRLAAVVLVALLLAISGFLIWESVHFVVTTWL